MSINLRLRYCQAIDRGFFDKFIDTALENDYHLNFNWLGVPVVQFPPDLVAVQEVIWETKPDLIIETGVARGGSQVFYASQMALLDACEHGEGMDAGRPRRRVLGVELELQDHARKAVTEHPLSRYIDVIEGSSIDEDVFSRVKEIAD